jgi:ubiquinone/menaquinone biosynthesis C-methylase UbiE
MVSNLSRIELDIGCGFTEGVQVPVYADISLDLNMNRVEPEFLRKLKEKGSHPICASATHLPFRPESMKKVYWRAVLEHLPNFIARQGIKEGVRVLEQGGEAEIILPIITAHMRHYIIILFTQFPFSLRVIQIALWRAMKYWKIEGVPHLTIIKPWDLEPYFSKVVWRADHYRHKWFHYPWGRVTRRFVNNRFINDMQGQYLVRCRK